MSFQALSLLHLEHATSHGDVETVSWKPASASNLVPRRVSVVIERVVEALNDSDRSIDQDAPSPVIVHVPKSVVPRISTGRNDPDYFVWHEKTYRVSAVIGNDPAGWELYCVR